MGSVIIGANTLDQLKEDIAAFTIQLSPETLAVRGACAFGRNCGEQQQVPALG